MCRKRPLPYYDACTPYVVWAGTVCLDAIPEADRELARAVLLYYAAACRERESLSYENKGSIRNMSTTSTTKFTRFFGLAPQRLSEIIGHLCKAGLIKNHTLEWHEFDIELLCNWADPSSDDYRPDWLKYAPHPPDTHGSHEGQG